MGSRSRGKQGEVHEGLERRLVASRINYSTVLAHHSVAPRDRVDVVTIDKCPHRGPDDPVVDKVEFFVEHVADIASRSAATLIMDVEVVEASLRDSIQERRDARGPDAGYGEGTVDELSIRLLRGGVRRLLLLGDGLLFRVDHLGHGLVRQGRRMC